MEGDLVILHFGSAAGHWSLGFDSSKKARAYSIISIATVLMMAMFQSHAIAATIHVPGDQPTIQSAINAASNGDTVAVASGTYHENIVLSGTTLQVIGVAGPQSTTIDGGQNGTVVTISGCGSGTLLSGFTIINGSTTSTEVEGGGVRIENSQVTVSGNIITNNQAIAGGGGIAVKSGAPVIQSNIISNNGETAGYGGGEGGGILIQSVSAVLSNTITGNSAYDGGGIMLNDGGQSIIMNNTISGNTASGVFNSDGTPIAGGGAIALYNDSAPLIVQNLIFDNTADLGAAIYMLPDDVAGGTLLVNNTIADNNSTQNAGSAIYAGGYSSPSELFNNLLIGSDTQNAVFCDGSFDSFSPVFENNDAYSGGSSAFLGICGGIVGSYGNISTGPLFMDAESGDFHLSGTSPAIDAGVNSAPNIPTTDYYGNPRIVAGRAGDGAVIDMGAAEYQPPSPIATLVPSPSPTPIPNVIRVPIDQPTIQDAINAASGGEIIQVAPGTYFETINFEGKAVQVVSTQGAANTIIDAHGAGTVVSFVTGETTASVLSGFSITGGLNAEHSGAGLVIQNASPTITNNIITGNQACSSGAGILLMTGSPVISNNVIANNTQFGNDFGDCSGGGGGGIAISGTGAAQIISNKISQNSIPMGGNGGGISIALGAGPLLMNNEISGNLASGVSGSIPGIPNSPADGASTGGGITIDEYSAPILVQNLIIDNQGDLGGGVFVYAPRGSSGAIFVNNTIAGNISTRNIGAGVAGAGEFDFNAATEFYNNIIEQPDAQNPCYCSSGSPIFKNNDVFSNRGTAYGGKCVIGKRVGNISADPLFASIAADNYELLAGSPAIDAGVNSAPDIPATDYYGNPRVIDGKGGNKVIIDIGAAESQSSLPAPKPEKLTVTPPSMALGRVVVGTTSITHRLTIVNPSRNPPVSVSVSHSASPTDFQVTNLCLPQLLPGQRCSIDVEFKPSATGRALDTLTITGVPTASAAEVKLNGVGFEPK